VTPAAEHAVIATEAFIRTSDKLFATVESIALLARLYVLQGRLRQAMATYAQVAQLVPQAERLQTLFTSLYYYFGLGNLLCELNDLDAAERYLSQGIALINERLTLGLSLALLGYTSLARLQQARGNSRAALATLEDLAHLAEQRHFVPHSMTKGVAIRAQLELVQGNLGAAIHWANSSGLSTEDKDLTYSHEGEYLALARVRIAQGRDEPSAPFLQGALRLLERLHQDAETRERMGSVLEILVLRALAHQAQGDRTAALSTLEQALLLAAPEGYIRLFIDEGEPMLALLRLAWARGMVPGYVATLLAAFGEHTTMDPAVHTARPGSLMEPFTEREREVLHLLFEGASNHEIARHLVISLNTVKKHVYNICGKLGVQSRAQAIVRARTLNLP
jgi:LuxR family maltose regulon positive regulatory protein